MGEPVENHRRINERWNKALSLLKKREPEKKERKELFPQENNFYHLTNVRFEAWKYLYHQITSKNADELSMILEVLRQLEKYFGYPGLDFVESLEKMLDADPKEAETIIQKIRPVIDSFWVRFEEVEQDIGKKFQILIISDPHFSGDETRNFSFELRRILRNEQSPYEIVCVHTFQDAIVATLFNEDIQCVIFDHPLLGPAEHFSFAFQNHLQGARRFIQEPVRKIKEGAEPLSTLIQVIQDIRPELDLFFVTFDLVESLPSYVRHSISRIFSAMDDPMELHLSILERVKRRASKPFFQAIKEYAEIPVGVFHALAISRGNALLKSKWIDDVLRFYGRNLFKAESSATCGGLDSFLKPHGVIKEAHALAAKAFGGNECFFVTNGTSTAVKIVIQGVTKPGDIALIDRDCHKSIHYGVVLNGVYPCYLNKYSLDNYSLFGAVPLRTLKKQLLDYKRLGKLDRVQLIILTNCTFDGIVYNVEKVMLECLAIKPDLIFLWDEAWFAYAYFNPILRCRTAMGAANRLLNKFQSKGYREEFSSWQAKVGPLESRSEEDLLSMSLLPDPSKAKVRVYSTQSNHKSLTALRQGSMINILDEDYGEKVEYAFREAFYTHTSTSPNYQILGTLDAGRAQMSMEGYRLVNQAIEAAFDLRKAVACSEEVKEWFRFLTPEDMIPAEYRTSSGIKNYFDVVKNHFVRLETAFLSEDEFVLEPTRLTLFTGDAGIKGDDFKIDWLMNKYEIQVNKTAINSVLFQTNIGTTPSATDYLLLCLEKAVNEIKKSRASLFEQEKNEVENQILKLTKELPPLPYFSRFDAAFGSKDTPEGDMRSAFYLAREEYKVDYFGLERALEAVKNGEILVGTTFIIPYPPGYPIIVPGQVITLDILKFLSAVELSEIHGYNKQLGLRIFKPSTLEEAKKRSSHTTIV